MENKEMSAEEKARLERKKKEREMVERKARAVAKDNGIDFSQDWEQYFLSYRLLGFSEELIVSKWKEEV
jgi:hypothetical protein